MNRIDVVVIDDEKVVRDAIGLVLRSRGYQVVGFGDATSALADPSVAACQLVICDLMLPDGSGLDAVRELRNRRPDLPVIVITGYATSDRHAAALGAGASEFLPKPFDDLELSTLVRRVLDRSVAAGKEARP